MDRIVECVPNFSEGRRLDVVDRLCEAVEKVPGAFLLDRTSDPSHNRNPFKNSSKLLKCQMFPSLKSIGVRSVLDC